MATRAPLPAVDSAQIVARHAQLLREGEEINHRLQLREQQELRALQDDKQKIQDAIREERRQLVDGLPMEMPFPESFDKFLMEKCDTQLRKRQEEYEIAKQERKKVHDAELLQHATKWKGLFSVKPDAPVSAPDLQLVVPESRPKRPLEVTQQHPIAFQTGPQPRTEQGRPVEIPRGLGHQREGMVPVVPSQAHQFSSIVVPQPLLPRPPQVPSQANRDAQTRLPPTNVPLHHQLSQPRPAEIQRAPFQPAPARLPDRPPVAKPRTALPDTGRPPEGMRPDLTRPPPLGSYPLPRILPQEEQQHRAHLQRPENEQFKRKADAQPVPPQADVKRTKVQETKDTDSSVGRTPKKSPSGRKSLSFDEVYQNGNPQFKHIIVEYPMNSRKFYILRCEEHGVHFNQNPLAGAAKHLHSAQHGNMSKERAQAVEYLGYQIYDCDEAKMRQNNEMVTDAFAKGYKPLNLNQLTKAERASLNLPTDNSPSGTPKAPAQRTSAREGFIHHERPAGAPLTQKAFTGITNPVPGELYLGYWATEKRNYAVLMLPLGDLKPSGMQGTLESTGLLEAHRIPKCYVRDEATGAMSWAPGYEDQGPFVSKREFPVMYFDGRSSVGWLRAKDLSPFNFDDPLWRDIPYFRDAVNHYAHVRGFRDFQEMRDKYAGKDIRFYGRNQLGQLRSPSSTQAPTPVTINTKPQAQSRPVDNSREYPAPQGAPRPDNAMISPTDEVEMTDASPTSDRDSYQESISKGILDSDNDAEMANTDSRRTSISNRGENQAEQGAPEKVLKQPFAQPVPSATYAPRPIDMSRQYSDSSANGAYRTAPVGAPAVQMPPNTTSNVDGPAQRPTSNSRSPSEMAQIIASKALHLQSPEREPFASSATPHDAELARDGRSRNDSTSRPGSVSSNGHGYRRVEKIHAKSSNPYRASPNQSPSMSTTMLPDRRSENGTSQPSLSRNSSPASLHNILQNPSAPPQPVMARPGPLSQNGPASLQPPHARHAGLGQRPPPLDRNGPLTTSPQPTLRSPSQFSNGTYVPPSPTQPQGLGILPQPQQQQDRQTSRSPVQERATSANSSPRSTAMNPPTRTPTPVIIRGNSETLNGDRWRAVRNDSATQSKPSPPLPPAQATEVPQIEKQAVPGPVPTYPRPTVESPIEIPVTTQATTAAERGSNSPVQLRESKPSPSPFVKNEAGGGEFFDVARIVVDNELSFDHSKTGGQLLRLTVDLNTGTASASADGKVVITIEPKHFKDMSVQGSNVSPTASTVTLGGVDGKRLDLVFETSESSSGRIYARRFCRWLRNTNSVIEYRNQSHESGSLSRSGSAVPATSGSDTPASTVVVTID